VGKDNPTVNDDEHSHATPPADGANLLSVFQTEEKPYVPYDGVRPVFPGVDAIMARTAWYGATGRLFQDMDAIRFEMGKAGPIGQAALTRMDNLRANGWTFGSIGFNDPYMVKQYPNPFNRAFKMLTQGGYHDAMHGRVAFNPAFSAIYTSLGMAPGAARDLAGKNIHELTHGKYQAGWQAFEADPTARKAFSMLDDPVHGPAVKARLEKLGLADSVPLTRAGHGAEMIKEEFRALASQTIANNRMAEANRLSRLFPQTQGLGWLDVDTALRTDTTGSYIRNVWNYTGTKYLTQDQALDIARQYNRTAYGGGVFLNGAINPLAEQAVVQGINELPTHGPLHGTPTLESSLKSGGVSAGLLGEADNSAGAMSRFFSNPANRRFLTHGAQALGAVGLAFTVTDTFNAFEHSTGAGLGRLTGIGIDWAGFEAGSATGAWVGRGLALGLARRSPVLAGLAIPTSAIIGGLIGAQITHEVAGRKTEAAVQKFVDGYVPGEA
jgi:hypothetical protein